jgi:hypothetical protein
MFRALARLPSTDADFSRRPRNCRLPAARCVGLTAPCIGPEATTFGWWVSRDANVADGIMALYEATLTRAGSKRRSVVTSSWPALPTRSNTFDVVRPRNAHQSAERLRQRRRLARGRGRRAPATRAADRQHHTAGCRGVLASCASRWRHLASRGRTHWISLGPEVALVVGWRPDARPFCAWSLSPFAQQGGRWRARAGCDSLQVASYATAGDRVRFRALRLPAPTTDPGETCAVSGVMLSERFA